MPNIARRSLLMGVAGHGLDFSSHFASAQPRLNDKSFSTTQLIGRGSFLPASAMGAVGDGSDEQRKLQMAIDQIASTGGGVVLLDARTYIVDKPLKLKPNVELRGAGTYATTIKVGVDNTRVFTFHDGQKAGAGGLANLTIHGFADRNPTLGESEENRLVVLGPFDYAYFDRVRAVYSRHMSLTATSGRASAYQCIVDRSLRDAINFSGCSNVHIIDNIISECGDDAIAVHIPRGLSDLSDISDNTIIITGNRISKSFGIKCLGARNAIIQNNFLRFWYGYGINMEIDTYWEEGINCKFNISINNNLMLDGLNAMHVGAGNIGTAIFLTSRISRGSGANKIPVNVGELNVGSGDITSDDVFVNRHGSSWPRGPDANISISSNIVRQTLIGLSKFSDAGFGRLWNNQGVQDPQLTSLIFDVGAITLIGDFENILLNDNALHSVLWGVRLNINEKLGNGIVNGNAILRCVNGILLESQKRTSICNFNIGGNALDLDPFCQSPLRNRPLDGTWTSVISTNNSWCGISSVNVSGPRIAGNTFRNMRLPVQATNAILAIENNSYYYDWSGNNTKGIGEMISDPRGSHYFVDCDPRSQRFGKFSDVPDSSFVLAASAPPQNGWYVKGHFIRNETLSEQSEQPVFGWVRLTTGNAHTISNWAEIRATLL